jgi:hypothetical protein
MPIFHVKPGRHEAFAADFIERFGEDMALITTAEADEMRLFGPDPMTPMARRRFGDFIAFPYRPATLGFHPPDKPLGTLFLAVHAGLSPAEMRTPLIVVE